MKFELVDDRGQLYSNLNIGLVERPVVQTINSYLNGNLCNLVLNAEGKDLKSKEQRLVKICDIPEFFSLVE